MKSLKKKQIDPPKKMSPTFQIFGVGIYALGASRVQPWA